MQQAKTNWRKTYNKKPCISTQIAGAPDTELLRQKVWFAINNNLSIREFRKTIEPFFNQQSGSLQEMAMRPDGK